MPLVKHLVILRFRRDLPATEAEAILRAVGDLQGVIPGIVDYAWGPYSSPEGLNRGFTHAFVTTFASPAARDAYLPHPEHVRIVERILPALEGGIEGALAFDFDVRE